MPHDIFCFTSHEIIFVYFVHFNVKQSEDSLLLKDLAYVKINISSLFENNIIITQLEFL